MKQALIRFLVYLALLVIVFAVFGAPTPGPLSSQLDSAAKQGVSALAETFVTRLGVYLGYYAIAIGFWLLVFELTYRVFRRLRKPVDVP